MKTIFFIIEGFISAMNISEQNSNNGSSNNSNQTPERKPNLLDVMKSVLAAMIGVQSDENRERDFKQGNASDYIIVGIVFVIIFVITLMLVVSSVIGDV